MATFDCAPLRRCIIPILGVNKPNAQPSFIGNGVLVQFAKVWILLTAAHVADEGRVQSLYAPHSGAKRFLRLDRFWTSDAPHGVRANDKLDFAWCIIPYGDVVDICLEMNACGSLNLPKPFSPPAGKGAQ